MAVRNLIPFGRSRVPTLRDVPNPFLALHDEMNRLFNEFSRDWEGPGFGLNTDFGFPHVELSETDREVRVEAELPGLAEKDIELLMNDGVLTLRGEKKSVTEDKSRRLSERFYGRFERQIPLPSEVREDQVTASFKNGVLTVSLPKSGESSQKMRRIAIKS